MPQARPLTLIFGGVPISCDVHDTVDTSDTLHTYEATAPDSIHGLAPVVRMPTVFSTNDDRPTRIITEGEVHRFADNPGGVPAPLELSDRVIAQGMGQVPGQATLDVFIPTDVAEDTYAILKTLYLRPANNRNGGVSETNATMLGTLFDVLAREEVVGLIRIVHDGTPRWASVDGRSGRLNVLHNESEYDGRGVPALVAPTVTPEVLSMRILMQMFVLGRTERGAPPILTADMERAIYTLAAEAAANPQHAIAVNPRVPVARSLPDAAERLRDVLGTSGDMAVAEPVDRQARATTARRQRAARRFIVTQAEAPMIAETNDMAEAF